MQDWSKGRSGESGNCPEAGKVPFDGVRNDSDPQAVSVVGLR